MPVLAPPRSLRHPHHGETATFLQTAAESGGERTILHLSLCPAGGESLARRAAYDKQVEVLAGTLTVYVDGVPCHVDAGEVAVIPAGASHRLANDSLSDVDLLLDIVPGHAGFERALVASYGLAAEGLVSRRGIPMNPYFLATLLEWSETSLEGAAESAVRTLAARARERGLDRALAERYGVALSGPWAA